MMPEMLGILCLLGIVLVMVLQFYQIIEGKTMATELEDLTAGLGSIAEVLGELGDEIHQAIVKLTTPGIDPAEVEAAAQQAQSFGAKLKELSGQLRDTLHVIS